MTEHEQKAPKEARKHARSMVDPDTGAATGASGKSSSSVTGRGAKAHEKTPPDKSEQAGAHNIVDRHAQSSIGGRSPAHEQTAMGDQDSTQSRNDIQLADPMTSRGPKKS